MEVIKAVEGLGKTPEELRTLLGITEQGALQLVDEATEYLAFRKSGIAVRVQRGRVTTIFLYSDGYDGFDGYRGDTGGLRLDTSKQIVRFKLGQPSQAAEDPAPPILGTVPIYDRYDYEDFSYHFQYDPTGKRVQMLTIMSAGEVARIGK